MHGQEVQKTSLARPKIMSGLVLCSQDRSTAITGTASKLTVRQGMSGEASLQLHEAIGNALAGKAAQKSCQAVLQELDAQAGGAVQHSVPRRASRARCKYRARNVRQYLLHACVDECVFCSVRCRKGSSCGTALAHTLLYKDWCKKQTPIHVRFHRNTLAAPQHMPQALNARAPNLVC